MRGRQDAVQIIIKGEIEMKMRRKGDGDEMERGWR